MADDREQLLQQASAEIADDILRTAGKMQPEFAERHGIDDATADLVLAMAFLRVAAAMSAVAYGLDETQTGKRFSQVIRELLVEPNN
jgi:hypothetical protein